ncbi:MAG TPA: hypothetical protein VHV74_04515 [Pseudonocardiaceae bacterium]|jgi:hypothetical protein|nr:hypothetical protein [Pseudonocardiaceae bacterium]
MRKRVLIGAMLLAGLAGSIAVVPASATPARDVPTCLIANAGHGYAKAITCAELRHAGPAVAGTGRYTGAPGLHTLTVTLQAERIDRRHHHPNWVTVESTVRRGFGNLSATTRGMRAPRTPLRACASVNGSRTVVCTAS